MLYFHPISFLKFEIPMEESNKVNKYGVDLFEL